MPNHNLIKYSYSIYRIKAIESELFTEWKHICAYKTKTGKTMSLKG